MIKAAVRLFILWFSVFSLSSASDWRSEVANLINQGNDFEAAAHYLEQQLDSLSEEDKPVASSLLAFFFHQFRDRENEYRRLGEYFEKYGPLDISYEFLPISVRNSLVLYFRDWTIRYPWVLKLGFVASTAPPKKEAVASPPRELVLGVDMANDAYYKLFFGPDVLKGGQFKRGFNSLTIETDKFFAQPGTYPFSLELKAGDRIVRRELAVVVSLSVFGILGDQSSEAKPSEYLLKMFLGDELLALSRKTVAQMPPAKIETPPPTGVYDPWGPGYQNKPEIPTGFPIGGIPALISELLKSLKKKDEIEPVPPVELKPDITVFFKKKNPDGRNVEILARVSLGFKDIKFYSFSASQRPT